MLNTRGSYNTLPGILSSFHNCSLFLTISLRQINELLFKLRDLHSSPYFVFKCVLKNALPDTFSIKFENIHIFMLLPSKLNKCILSYLSLMKACLCKYIFFVLFFKCRISNIIEKVIIKYILKPFFGTVYFKEQKSIAPSNL